MNDKGNGIINSDIESKYSDLIDEKVNRAIDIRIKQYWNYLKVFLYGLGTLFIILIILGLLGRADIIRYFHNQAFPPETPNTVVISYESVIELRANDDRLHYGSMNFYAEKGHMIELYLKIQHSIEHNEGEKERKISIFVDNIPISNEPIAHFFGGFQDITDKLNWNSDIGQQPKSVHQVGIQLDDTQLGNLENELNINCVIIVRSNPR